MNYYLWKLKYFKGSRIKKKQVDLNNMPDDIAYKKFLGHYIKIDTDKPINEELEKYLRIKNAYNFNLIRISVVVSTVFFVIAVLSTV